MLRFTVVETGDAQASANVAHGGGEAIEVVVRASSDEVEILGGSRRPVSARRNTAHDDELEAVRIERPH